MRCLGVGVFVNTKLIRSWRVLAHFLRTVNNTYGCEDEILSATRLNSLVLTVQWRSLRSIAIASRSGERRCRGHCW